jgi:predicted P-loop ATPase/GTPase
MMPFALDENHKKEIEQTLNKGAEISDAIKSLPPFYEVWTLQDIAKLSPDDVDRLFIWFKNKTDIVRDRYEMQVYFKRRKEVRKDKLLIDGTDGR